MKYTVLWRPTAERKLNEIWNEAANKVAVSQAADEIDAQLRSRASQVGESRDGEAQFLSVGPLAVYFGVHEDDRTVDVWAVFQV